jgi:hypothetical protein
MKSEIPPLPLLLIYIYFPSSYHYRFLILLCTFLAKTSWAIMRRTGKRKAKTGIHKVEQDRVEGTVYSGPDFGAGVDENLYKVRKSQEEEEEKPLREQRREAHERL